LRNQSSLAVADPTAGTLDALRDLDETLAVLSQMRPHGLFGLDLGGLFTIFQLVEQAQLNLALELSIREAQMQPVPEPPKHVELIKHSVSLDEYRDQMSCSVCLNNFRYKEQDVVELKCGHVFHRDCIEPWFKTHHTCPLCRTDIDDG
jgi:hypothetical protein